MQWPSCPAEPSCPTFPYINTGLIIVLQTFPFSHIGILLSQTTPDNSFHLHQAAVILHFTSVSHPPVAVMVKPKYLKQSTWFSRFPWQSMMSTFSWILAQTI